MNYLKINKVSIPIISFYNRTANVNLDIGDNLTNNFLKRLMSINLPLDINIGEFEKIIGKSTQFTITINETSEFLFFAWISRINYTNLIEIEMEIDDNDGVATYTEIIKEEEIKEEIIEVDPYYKNTFYFNIEMEIDDNDGIATYTEIIKEREIKEADPYYQNIFYFN